MEGKAGSSLASTPMPPSKSDRTEIVGRSAGNLGAGLQDTLRPVKAARAMAEDMTSTFPAQKSTLPSSTAKPTLPAIPIASPISPIVIPTTYDTTTESATISKSTSRPLLTPTVSSSTIGPTPRSSRRPRSPPASPTLSRIQPSTSTTAISATRKVPILPHADVKLAPPTAMYWSVTPVSGKIPKGMRAHSAVVVNSDIWCFGGCDIKGACFRDVWKMDGDNFYWTKPKCIGTAPPVTRAHTCTAFLERLFVVGGGNGPSYSNDVYFLDTLSLTWTKPVITGTPPSPRRAHTAVLYRSKIIVFAGGNGVTALNDTYALDASDVKKMSWSKLETVGKAPSTRGYHSMNLVGSKAVVLGGSDGTECFSDVWILDLETLVWTEIDQGLDDSKLYPRLSHTSTRVGSYLFVIGGHDGLNFANDIILFNLVTLQWETRSIYGAAFSPRGYHTTVIYDSRLFLLGGFNGKTVFDDMHTLDLGASSFLPQITNFSLDVSTTD